ncbi:dynamin family protein [Aquisalibacillus elongatus]|uniref:Small GTP-binding protein n=1 Tax=Aquisalibacillus elongatus TaxID=485577 RepID=A0A3N5C8H2_9BACI|nr:dynamin family protein [Aquisalibacillus elongatus]RPF55832.1 small GTP-binding protein [Aquisalibacillus elongatus]
MITKAPQVNTINFDALWRKVSKGTFHQSEQKLKELYDKWENQTFTIGFTGHFSAGKSSLINAIIEEHILPSSPIPTSANIVELQYGEDKTIYDLNDGRQTMENQIHLDHVNELARNGEDVKSITIQRKQSFLENGVTLMDTPGIDSSNDAEFDRTLANVHLIDFFVYVMDYNHVQSEVNFKFLRELQDHDIPFIIVVNQIDKHNEQELVFDSFKQSLRNSCIEWNLEPVSIFYTSLMDDQHPLNQLTNLKQSLNELIDDKDEYIAKKLTVELNKIITEWSEEEFELTGQSYQKLNQIRQTINRLNEDLNHLHTEQNNYLQKLNQDIQDILNNAYIMTFETREQARAYLESLQPNFKVGKLFSKRKTEEEKQQRLDQFLKTINDRVKTEMTWHIRNYLLEQMQHHQIDQNNIVSNVQSFNIEVTKEHIDQAVNPSAEVNADSLLIYTDRLQKDLNLLCKKELTPLLSDLNTHVSKQLYERTEQIEQNLANYEAQANQHSDFEDLEVQRNLAKEDLIHETFNEESGNNLIGQAVKEEKVEYVELKDLLKPVVEQDNTEHYTKQSATTLNVDHIIQKTENVLSQIKHIEPLKPFYQSILKQFNRLNDSSMTVALFGAFSAGKSSFANAWIGDHILPSSPNPTTAAINKIRPVDDQHEHKEVLVQYKTTEQLFKQLMSMTALYLSETFDELDDLTRYLKQHQKRILPHLSKTESSFIEAYLKGIQDVKPSLGKEEQIEWEDFSKYVTVESISCFIEEMNVFYDCELTKMGITLVDTPGADSIHARHTNTSLHYVNSSDAIIYVTYYNHAFSRADREFLLQLGRVKDAFSLDKMFFILNASDLAQSEQELSLVEDYLIDQLNQYGITHPTVYPLSSKQLLSGEPSSESNVFFDRFKAFIKNDSKAIMANKVMDEQKRLEAFINETIQEANQSKNEQLNLIASLSDSIGRVKEELHQHNDETYKNRISQEIEELMHHMTNRVTIQLSEQMKDSINPASVNLNGKKGKEQLSTALKQLIFNINQKVLNEVRTISIVLDRSVEKTLNDWIKEINHSVIKDSGLTKMYHENDNQQTLPEFDLNIQLSKVELEELASFYKNQKDFYEEQKVQDLFERFKELSNSSISQQIDLMEASLQSHYLNVFENMKREDIKGYIDENEQLIHHKELIYQNDEVFNQLQSIQSEISE